MMCLAFCLITAKIQINHVNPAFFSVNPLFSCGLFSVADGRQQVG
jgi:hypothetical protein